MGGREVGWEGGRKREKGIGREREGKGQKDEPSHLNSQ